MARRAHEQVLRSGTSVVRVAARANKVRVGKTIPVDLYLAVAEVLAFVYRLRNRGLRA